jgi:AraC-like DNA-binding protein
MDVLSDVLMSVRLTGAVFFDVDARSPFVTESPSVASLDHEVLSGAEHVIAFHVVTEGTCWAEIIDGGAPPVALAAGDMVAFPAGDANVMASAPGMRGSPDPSLYQRPPDRTLPFSLQMSRESTADRTRFVCGFLGCDSRPFNPLLDSLPRIVHSPVSAQSRQWVASLIDAAVDTSGGEPGAGREAMLAKLAELMFVEALRGHLAQLGDDERGWLAGVRHPQVGAALRLMHGRPADPWTLERLARGVGMSRSSFAEQFTTYVRISPMQYLTRWRLQLAARLLESSSVSVAQAASAVGYQSEAAFNRAFKREVGEAPGTWQRALHTPDPHAATPREPG